MTRCLCLSFLLTLLPISSVQYLPWDTILHKLLQCGSFPESAVLQELLHHGSFAWGAVLLQQTAPAWVTHGVTSPASKTVPSVGFSLHGSTGPGRSLLQHGISTGSQCPSDIHLLWCGVLPWATGGYLLHCGPSMGCGGRACLTTVLIMGCRGTSPPASGVPPLPFLLH